MALDWDLVGTPIESQGRAIAYSPTLDRWVMLGESVFWSDDGINWTEGTAADYHAVTNFVAKSGVIWCPNSANFIAICRDNNFVNDTHILTSPDGKTWTTRTGDGVPLFNSIAFEPVTGFLVIVADNGGCITSSDGGQTWTAAGNDLVGVDAAVDWNRVVWNPFNSIFVAVGENGNIPIATSPDGLNWTGRHGFEPAKQSTWEALAVNPNNGFMVALAGVNGQVVMRSDDGITWEDKYSIAGLPVLGNSQCYRVLWSDTLGAFVALIQNNVTEEGVVWTNIDGESANWAIDSVIPDTVVSSGSAWEWQELAENPNEPRFIAGNENPSDEPLATALSGVVTITGDAEIGIEDHSLLSLDPSEIIGFAELAILVLAPNEMIGTAVLAVDGNPRTVFSADASGLYILVPGKTNDTIYLRDAEDDVTVETLDIAIPDPTVGTAYVGG